MTQTELDEVRARWAKYPANMALWSDRSGAFLATPADTGSPDTAAPALPYNYLDSYTVGSDPLMRDAWMALTQARRDVERLLILVQELDDVSRKATDAVKSMSDGIVGALTSARKVWGLEVAQLQNELARYRGREVTNAERAPTSDR